MKKTSLFLLFLGMCGFFLANSGLTQDSGEPDTLYFSGYPCSPDGDTLFIPAGGGYARILINVWNDDSLIGITVPLIESASGPPAFAFMNPVYQNVSVQPLCYKGGRIYGWGSLNLELSSYPPRVEYGAVTFGTAMPPGDGLIATMFYTVNDTGRICLDTTVGHCGNVVTFVRPPAIGFTPQAVSRCFQIAHYSGDTVYVDDDAPPGWYDSLHVHTIQEGIDSVAEGQMVYVYNGAYYENPTVDKRLFLIGESMDNVVVDGGGADVVFTISAQSVHISGLTVQNGGSGKGLVIYSDGNSIYANNIKDAEYGIWLAGSADLNHIFHNNFLNNNTSAHVYTVGEVDIWDQGYPGGGNYWDDYAGVDNYYGPKQNAPGSDGIGDNTYIVSGTGNKDRYPLMNPWDGTYPVPPVDTAWVDDNYDGITPGFGFDRFRRIQDGSNAVISGGTVLVFNGAYSANFTINKKLSLIGEDKDSTIIDAQDSSTSIITITADLVSITGFTVQNTNVADTTPAIMLLSNYNTISGNTISNNGRGLFLQESIGNSISSNTMVSNQYACIRLVESSGNTISGNELDSSYIVLQFSSSNDILDNTIQGGKILLGVQCSTNTISGNIISDSDKGIELGNNSDLNLISGNTISLGGGPGIRLEQSSNNTITNNDISDRSSGIEIVEGQGNSVEWCSVEMNECGIHLATADDNVITFCRMDGNSSGVHVENGHNNIVKWCKFQNNTSYAIELVGSSNISIYSNNFIGNNGATAAYDTAHIQAYDDSADVSFWNTDYPLGGNYWSDYNENDDSSGVDQNLPGSDGIGDTPYPLHPLNVGNKDNYPLMGPWAPVCGDVDYTALVDVVDIVYLVNYKFRMGPEPIPHQCAGDVSGDGITNIVDIVYLVNYLFKSDVPPVPGCCELNY